MKTFFIYGYVIGLALASPITRIQECKEGLRRIDNTENDGDHEEKTADIQKQPHSAETPKMDPPMKPLLNDTGTGMQATKDESGVKKQTASIKIRRSIIKMYQHRRDISHLTHKLPRRRASEKKHRPNKIIQSLNVYNISRKIHGNDMFKHKLEKGSIMKQLQKRSIDYEDTPNDPNHSPDNSYNLDTQEDFSENGESQEPNESADSTNNVNDYTSNMNENSDHTDSNESDHTSSNESNSPQGSPESSSPVEPNESNSSNESSYNVESEESISDVTNNPTVLNEASDSLESFEPTVQNSVFTTPVSQTTNGLSESRFSSESLSQDDSSQSNEPNESNKSSDSSSNESSNSSDSNTSSQSTESTIHSDSSTENSSQYIEGTVNTDDIEENEINS